MDYSPIVQELIESFRQLPSVGPRSAERLALFILESPSAVSERLASALREVKSKIQPCRQCSFFSESSLCPICQDPNRDSKLWCIVEKPHDVLKIEKTGAFKGLYHVLGGRLSPIEGITPDDLNITLLEKRIDENPPEEIVIALSADVEGETTSLYIAQLLRGKPIKVSRPATGLPAGGGLEFADSVTLGYALNGRRQMSS
ncbi:MAG: recombination mediator RecR [Verrucomicrobiota bacterium]